LSWLHPLKSWSLRETRCGSEAVIQALEGDLRRETEKEPLADRIARIAAELAAAAGPNRRRMTKDEIDAMWGH
jgi:antitoxin VapB